MSPAPRRPARGRVLAGGLLLLVAIALFAPVTAGQTGTGAPETDNTVTRIELHPDGGATWTVQVRMRLETAEDVERYEAFQSALRANRSRFLDPFRTRMSRVVARAGEVTGRDMAASDFSIRTSFQEVPRRWGVVTYRFEWDGFAAVDGDRLLVGDVFDAGFFLAANDTLEITAPDGFALSSVQPAPHDREEGRVVWRGRVDFADGRPAAVAVPAGTAGTVGTRTAPPPGSPTVRPDPGPPDWGILAVVGAVVVAGLALGFLALRRRAAGRGRSPDDAPPEPAPGAGLGEAVEDDGSGIRTDPERVVDLLNERGGRMRQAEIADALGWSTSKTSRVLTSMDEEGRVRKLQLGRENVIDLPEE